MRSLKNQNKELMNFKDKTRQRIVGESSMTSGEQG